MRRAILLGFGAVFLFCVPQAHADSESVDRATSGIKESRFSNDGRLNRDARIPYASDRIKAYRRIDATRYTVLRGKRGRKYVRRFSLPGNLTGDKLRVYELNGYTPHRLAFNYAGRRTERWTYHKLGVEYTFDHHSGELIKTRYFPPEGNHID